MSVEVRDHQSGKTVTYEGSATVRREGDVFAITDKDGGKHMYFVRSVDIHETPKPPTVWTLPRPFLVIGRIVSVIILIMVTGVIFAWFLGLPRGS